MHTQTDKEIHLKGKGRLRVLSAWDERKEDTTPRALNTLSQIIENDLCHRCGSCVGICPTQVLGLDQEEYPIVKNLSACTDCDLCVKVCPGEEFNHEKFSNEIFESPAPLEDMHGSFKSAAIAYSARQDIRDNSTSGGLITGLLIDQLQKGNIDGALVVVSDEQERWKGKPIIARTEQELLDSMKSKYAIAPTNVVLDEIRNTEGRYAVVGLPCQVHGILKASELDRKIRERVVLRIGIFCHAAVEHDPMKYLWSQLESEHSKIKRFISRVGKHPGTPHVEYEDGTLRPVYFPNSKGYRPSSMEIINIMYRLFTPQRCLTCYDSTSEFADIAVGDPWMAPPSDDVNFKDGYSFVLLRTEAGKHFYNDSLSTGAINSLELEDSIARTSNTLMGVEKRWRAFRVMQTRSRQGKAVPDYSFEPPKSSGKHFILTELNMLSHFFCFLKSGKLSIFKFILSPGGYFLLRLNHFKREFRNWRRDTLAKLKRRAS